MIPQRKTSFGFTLLELSIVLVIIGLIAGGVLTGRALNEAANINQAVAMHGQFLAAWNSFKATYNAIPGDMPNATKYWGTHSVACPLLPGYGTASTAGTCNGNGDGKVRWYSYDGFVSAGGDPTGLALADSASEASMVFRHLELAGLLKGEYYVSEDLGPMFRSDGFFYYYIPKFSKQQAAVWFVGANLAYADLYYAGGGIYSGTAVGNALQTARFNAAAQGAQPRVGLETPTITHAIDVKMDDGKPKGGKFEASNGYGYGTTSYLLECVVSDGAGGYNYNLTYTGDSCRYLLSLD